MRSLVLGKQKQKMMGGSKQVGYVALQEAAEFARNNNIAILAVRESSRGAQCP